MQELQKKLGEKWPLHRGHSTETVVAVTGLALIAGMSAGFALGMAAAVQTKAMPTLREKASGLRDATHHVTNHLTKKEEEQ